MFFGFFSNMTCILRKVNIPENIFPSEQKEKKWHSKCIDLNVVQQQFYLRSKHFWDNS
jgi:hypothetical protein